MNFVEGESNPGYGKFVVYYKMTSSFSVYIYCSGH